MTPRRLFGVICLCLGSLLGLAGCQRVQAHADGPKDGSPPEPKVTFAPDASLFTVDHPEQFPLANAVEYAAASEMVVTGTVTPDVSRNVPVVSLASGRVVSIHARLGDTVKKGQVLLTLRSDDISGGYSNYRKAVADQALARTQLERATDLFALGAIRRGDLEVAQDTFEKARIDVDTMAEHLRLLGDNPDEPNFMVHIAAPISGVITDQQVTLDGAVQAFNTPSPFTISDMTSVWIVCDVYENDLADVKIGDAADITMNAFPNRMFRGRVSNIGAILDPNIRTAKVRIEMPNPGNLRLGMFARATFRGQAMEMHTVVPASAVLHMHDRDFVFVPAPGNRFKRVEVVGGDPLVTDKSKQEIRSGLMPGQQVVANALVLDHVLGQ